MRFSTQVKPISYLKANANYVLDALMETVERLTSFPDRGPYPKELIGLGIQEYRHIFIRSTGH